MKIAFGSNWEKHAISTSSGLVTVRIFFRDIGQPLFEIDSFHGTATDIGFVAHGLLEIVWEVKNRMGRVS